MKQVIGTGNTLLALLAVIGTSAVTASVSRMLPEPVVDADYYDMGTPAQEKVELGRLLFFDKILSGNRNIACATCHHPLTASGDALALPLGEGPRGLGLDRATGDEIDQAVAERVPRNSPALWNLGAKEFERLFHDGRVESDPEGFFDGGFITPAKWKLPRGLDNVLAAQAMFPVTSPAEMAGGKGENSVADAVSLNNAAGPDGVWEQLGKRLREIPEYVELFERAFPGQVSSGEDINYVLAANAIAAFESEAFRADNSPFDRYLRGEHVALSESARRGMELFYGEAGCSGCHSGKFQTDHEFHAIAMPQIGPGKQDGTDSSYWEATGLSARLEDFGRGRETFREEDRFKFRTPSLRNVATTGPWGHSGAYDSLEAVVRHHLDPVKSLNSYDRAPESLPALENVVELVGKGSEFRQERIDGARLEDYRERDLWVQRNEELRSRIAAANELETLELSDAQVQDLLEFLESLSDLSALDVAGLVPDQVPSGLPVGD